MVHPWHDVPVGEMAPRIVNIIVECPKDSKVKYELDKPTGLLAMNRYLYSAVHYPGDYGFVPKTLWDDGDPLDVMVLSYVPAYPLAICEVKLIGLVQMKDEKTKDDKLIAVHANDPRFSQWNSIKDVPSHLIAEIRNFLEIYKQLQGSSVKVFEVQGVKEARAALRRAVKLYKQKFSRQALDRI
jgi:inorganic pyrophosphatase